MIRLSGVSYKYAGEVRALRDVTIDVSVKGLTAIVGPNGSGKSTMARLMTGLLLPSGGSVQIDGHDTLTTDARFIRGSVAFAWQNPDNQMVCGVVEDDVAFGPENLGLEPREIQNRVDDVLARLNISELRSQAVYSLSSAQRQLLAVAGAMAMRSRYLVLDEVTSRLDPASAHRLLDQLIDWSRDYQVGIVMITHLMSEVARSDHVIVMGQDAMGGFLSRQGTPRQILGTAHAVDGIELTTPLIAMIQDLEHLGVRVEGLPETVEELVEALCR